MTPKNDARAVKYRKLALAESDRSRADLLLKLADEADRDVLCTSDWLDKNGMIRPPTRPRADSSFLIFEEHIGPTPSQFALANNEAKAFRARSSKSPSPIGVDQRGGSRVLRMPSYGHLKARRESRR